MLATIVALCLVTDGDTLRCGKERIRLIGIDAPEMAGHCRKGRACAPGDPHASKDSLVAAVKGRKLQINRVGTDRYGRTLGVVYAAGVNLSCHQLDSGNAIYKPKWDEGGVIGRECL